MKLVENSINKPVSVVVGIILIVMFGALSVLRIPIQLTPTVERPSITVETVWTGASPQEVEREIIQEQEEQLKSVEGVVEMKSESMDGRGRIVLEFQVGTNIDAALLKVSNKLNQVPEYPATADEPVISSINVSASAMAWFVLRKLPGNDVDIYTLYNFVDDYVCPQLERVAGVADSQIYGGQESEMVVTVDPDALAARGITLQQLALSLDLENANTSAGDFNEGKRRYVVRTLGEFRSPKEVEDVIVAQRNGAPVYVRDIATVNIGYKDAYWAVRCNSEPTIVLNCLRQTGSNSIVVMRGIHKVLRELNEGLLKDRGLELVQVYDETEFIKSSIKLVQQNLLVGALLAIAVLLLFLRSISSTLIIALAIPISVVGTFMMMTLLGRNLNLVSLAGMCFAVGMVVDCSVVVLENIYRHLEMGKARFQAAYDGTVEVWGAILASVLTTIAVFLPVVFVQEEAGQLFRDIAVAVSCAVALSLLVGITVIPTFSARVLRAARKLSTGPDGTAKAIYARRSLGNLWGLGYIPARVPNLFARLVYNLCGSVGMRIGVCVILTTLSLGVSWVLMPETEYLPTGKRNIIFGVLVPPPGYNVAEYDKVAMSLEEDVKQYWESESPAQRLIKYFYFVAQGRQVFMAARATNSRSTDKLIPLMKGVLGKVPGMFSVVMRASIFQQEFLKGRSIDIEITGPELPRLVALGGQIFMQLFQVIPGAQMRPIPSLDLGNPEVQVTPDRERAAELGLSSRELGYIVQAAVDGFKASDYQHEGNEIDLTVRSVYHGKQRTQDLKDLVINTPGGRLVTLGSVADVRVLTGPEQINHIERQRAITIQVAPPEQMPLETAMRVIGEKVIEPLRASGTIGGAYNIRLAGTADKLTTTRRALQWNFLLALVITYLLMCSLFESFLYPFVIMFSVPLAAMGGFIGLRLVSRFVEFQQLDVIGMLGFVILIGVVVNNAILIVHQALNNMRYHDMAPREAISESVRTRVRPIFMTTATTVFGMAPLVVVTGPGSELYRGLGSVMLGGLICSTIFTLVLVPTLFSLMMDAKLHLGRASAEGNRTSDEPLLGRTQTNDTSPGV